MDHGHQVLAYGNKKGNVRGVEIAKDWEDSWKVDTVTMYVGPQNQEDLMDKIIELKPERVIFNPGTENPFFYKKLGDKGIAYEEACTLVLLSTGQY